MWDWEKVKNPPLLFQLVNAKLVGAGSRILSLPLSFFLFLFLDVPPSLQQIPPTPDPPRHPSNGSRFSGDTTAATAAMHLIPGKADNKPA